LTLFLFFIKFNLEEEVLKSKLLRERQDRNKNKKKIRQKQSDNSTILIAPSPSSLITAIPNNSAPFYSFQSNMSNLKSPRTTASVDSLQTSHSLTQPSSSPYHSIQTHTSHSLHHRSPYSSSSSSSSFSSSGLSPYETPKSASTYFPTSLNTATTIPADVQEKSVSFIVVCNYYCFNIMTLLYYSLYFRVID
jgi:hypothetical protein